MQINKGQEISNVLDAMRIWIGNSTSKSRSYGHNALCVRALSTEKGKAQTDDEFETL